VLSIFKTDGFADKIDQVKNMETDNNPLNFFLEFPRMVVVFPRYVINLATHGINGGSYSDRAFKDGTLIPTFGEVFYAPQISIGNKPIPEEARIDRHVFTKRKTADPDHIVRDRKAEASSLTSKEWKSLGDPQKERLLDLFGVEREEDAYNFKMLGHWKDNLDKDLMTVRLNNLSLMKKQYASYDEAYKQALRRQTRTPSREPENLHTPQPTS